MATSTSLPTIIFCDINASFVEKAKEVFGDEYLGITIQYIIGDISELRYENTVYVSPANSRFLYRGGVDGVYAKMFNNLETTAQIHIKRFSYSDNLRHHYCPIGSAALISVTHNTNPVLNNYILATPTMRSAERLHNNTNIVEAVIATLRLVNKYNKDPLSIDKIQKVIIPGMGTGVGGLTVTASIDAIKSAIETFIMKPDVIDKGNTRFAWVA